MKKKDNFIKIFRETKEKPRQFMVINFSNPPAEMYLDTEFQPINWK